MLDIYSIRGDLVKHFQQTYYDNGYVIGPIYWDGKDDFQEKIGRGTYVYKLKVKDDSGEIIQKLEKLVILR